MGDQPLQVEVPFKLVSQRPDAPVMPELAVAAKSFWAVESYKKDMTGFPLSVVS